MNIMTMPKIPETALIAKLDKELAELILAEDRACQAEAIAGGAEEEATNSAMNAVIECSRKIAETPFVSTTGAELKVLALANHNGDFDLSGLPKPDEPLDGKLDFLLLGSVAADLLMTSSLATAAAIREVRQLPAAVASDEWNDIDQELAEAISDEIALDRGDFQTKPYDQETPEERELLSAQSEAICKRTWDAFYRLCAIDGTSPRAFELKALALAYVECHFYPKKEDDDRETARTGPYRMLRSIGADLLRYSDTQLAAVIRAAQSSPRPPKPPRGERPIADESALIHKLDVELAAVCIRFAQENADACHREDKVRNLEKERAAPDKMKHAKWCAENSNDQARSALEMRPKLLKVIDGHDFNTKRGAAFASIARASYFLRRLSGEFRSIFGRMDNLEKITAENATYKLSRFPDFAVSRLILAGDECTWVDTDSIADGVEKIEYVLFGTNMLAIAERRTYKGTDAELLRLAGCLEAIYQLRLQYRAIDSELVDCPFYEIDWQYRERINAIKAKTAAGIQAKSRSAEIALFTEPDESAEGAGTWREITESIEADLRAINARKKTSCRMAAA